MKTQLTLILAALSLCSCSTTDRIPDGTALTVGANPITGKQPVAVAVGGLQWRDALRKIGVIAVQVGAQVGTQMLVNEVQSRFLTPDNSK